MATKKVLVPLAEGFEVIEALSVVDVFRRAGVHVDTAALGKKREVLSSHQIQVLADVLLSEIENQNYDLIVLPGGLPGAENLKNSKILTAMLRRQADKGGLYSAICAAPAVVLGTHGLLEGKKATCHPGFINGLPTQDSIDQPVVVDGNCVTGRGAGLSIEFALTLLEKLMGSEVRAKVEQGMALTD